MISGHEVKRIRYVYLLTFRQNQEIQSIEKELQALPEKDWDKNVVLCKVNMLVFCDEFCIWFKPIFLEFSEQVTGRLLNVLVAFFRGLPHVPHVSRPSSQNVEKPVRSIARAVFFSKMPRASANSRNWTLRSFQTFYYFRIPKKATVWPCFFL